MSDYTKRTSHRSDDEQLLYAILQELIKLDDNVGNGTSGGWTDDGTTVRLTTTTDKVNIGSSVAATHTLTIPSPIADAMYLTATVNGAGKVAGVSVDDDFLATGLKGSALFYHTDSGDKIFYAFAGDEAGSSGAQIGYLNTDTGATSLFVATDADCGMSVNLDDTIAVLAVCFDPGGFKVAGKDTGGTNYAFSAYDGNITDFGGTFLSGVRNDGLLYHVGAVGIGSTEVSHTVDGTVYAEKLAVHSESVTDNAEFSLHRHTNSAGAGAHQVMSRSRGSEAAETVVQSGDNLGRIFFVGFDGTDYARAAEILGFVDNTPGNDDMPGRIQFGTTPDGSTTPLERVRIDSTGLVTIFGNTASAGRILLNEDTDNGTNGITLTVPASIGTSRTITLPDTAPSAGYFVQTDASGIWSYISPTIAGAFTFVADNNMYAGTDALTALTTGDNNTVVGFSALNINTTGSNNTAFGNTALLSNEIGDYNTAVGSSSGVNVTGSGNTFIGAEADGGSGSSCTAIGRSATVGNFSESIVIGLNATATASNQLVIGSETGEITEAYIGEGVTSATPAAFTFAATGGSGTDISGANLTIAGGKPTGAGAGGHVIIQTAAAGAAGTTLRSLSTIAEFTDDAKIGFFGVTPVIRQTELTDELTTITHSAPGTPDYAIQDLVAATGFGFVTSDEAQTVLSVIANLQARVNELETKLTAYGLLIDQD